jgi:hypothetical protein
MASGAGEFGAPSRWLPPVKPREACVIPVRRDPLAAGFDSERSEPSVVYEATTRFCVYAQSLEDRPVPRSGRRDRRVWLLEQHTTEIEGIRSRGRTRKDARVGADSHEARKYLRSDSIRRGPLMTDSSQCRYRAWSFESVRNA